MEKKRKAAAEIFAKQYTQQQAPQEVISDVLTDEEEKEAPKMKAARRRVTLGAASAPAPQAFSPVGRVKTSEELQIEKEAINVRETGLWLWKRVIVPPNAYVVHTRSGHKDPMTLGLGVSFRYNPYTDAYLVVPSAMQTIGVVANCITKEKQGINILAYVQWQIDNFSVAYRKLDFSDTRDPLGIVNAQLGEQAEAAIKDKISTMSVEEVLTDKAPVIKELTTRLKTVAEGHQGEKAPGEGLGIKIITVQIREALVSSQKLWHDLQAPFRHQQEQAARISELTMQSEIHKKESETTQKKIHLEEQTTAVTQESQQRIQKQAAEMDQERELSTLQREQEKSLERAKLEAETNKRQKTLKIEEGLHALEEQQRLDEMKIQAAQQQLEQETTLKKQQVESKTLLQEKDDELQTLILEANLARQKKEHAVQLQLKEKKGQMQLALQEQELRLARLHQEVRNLINERDLLRQLIANLPELAAQMPDIHELKVLQTDKGNAAFDTFASFLAKTFSMAESLGIRWRTPDDETSKPQTIITETEQEEAIDSVDQDDQEIEP